MKHLYVIVAIIIFVIVAIIVDVTAVRVLIWAAVVVVIARGGIKVLSAVEEFRTVRAGRKAKDYEARRGKFMVVQDGFGMAHMLNLDTEYVENLSAFPGSHHNGEWSDPHPAAAAAWMALVGKTRADSPAKMLPELTGEQRLDLLTIFTQPSQSYAVIAGQQVGKTYQARYIARYWLSQGYRPMVIGPKWDQGEWTGCDMFGGGYNYNAVRRGLDAALRLAQMRHASTEMSHKQHPIQPIFFDDWTAIRAEIGNEAEDFIIRATTLFASVNIVLYFILHLDTANAWGVGKVGAALKNNFTKLIIEPGYDAAGLPDRSRNKGYLIRPGETKKDRVAIGLFNSHAPDMIFSPGEDVSKAEEDAIFVGLVETGKSRNEASLRAYGRPYAGNLVTRGKRALGEL